MNPGRSGNQLHLISQGENEITAQSGSELLTNAERFVAARLGVCQNSGGHCLPAKQKSPPKLLFDKCLLLTGVNDMIFSGLVLVCAIDRSEGCACGFDPAPRRG